MVEWTVPTLKDDSGSSALNSDYVSGDDFPIGDTVVTYTATDNEGSMFMHFFTVTVIDDEIPCILSRPGDQSTCTDSEQATARVTWREPTVTDNAGVFTVTSNYASGSNFPLGDSTVTYTIVDASGNTNTFSFIVTIYEAYNLLSVTPITKLDVTASTDVETFVLDGSLYFAALNGSTNETQNEVKIFAWNDASSNLTLIQTLETEDVHDIVPINIDGIMYLAVAESKPELQARDGHHRARRKREVSTESNSGSEFVPGTVIYKFDQTLQQFEHVQRLWTTGARLVTSLEIEGDPCLVIGAAYSTVGSDGLLQEMSAAYLWLGGHFDQFASFPTHGVTDILAFELHNRQYLAIANYADISSNVNINSEILIYNNHLHDLTHFQFIETKGAKDWEYFGSGTSRHREHFLAVVNNPNNDEQYTSMIYKYFDGRFVPFQCIDTIGAVRWHAVTDEDNDLLLLVLATAYGVHFYGYDGWWFKQTDHQYSLGGPSFGFVSMLWDDKYLLGVAEGSSDRNNLIELTFTEHNPLEKRHQEVAAMCNTNMERLANLTHDQEVIRNETSNLVYINSEEPQIITGNITLATNVTVEDIVVDKGNITLTTNVTVEDIVVDKGESIETSNLVYINSEEPQIITGNITLATNVTVEDIVVDKDEPQIITGNITLATNVTVEDIVVDKEEPQIITGNITLATNVTVEDIVVDKGESIETSNLVYINSEEPQIITGNITLATNVTVEDIVVDKVYVRKGLVLDEAGLAQLADIRSFYDNNTKELNDLEDKWNHTMKLFGDQNITGDKEFRSVSVTGDLTVESLTVESGFISGNISVEDLDNNTARTDRTQTFTAPITFADQVNILSNLYVSGDLDYGIDTSHLVTLSRNHTITAQKSFQEYIDITGNLDVEGTIDSINISPETIMLSYGDQTFTGDLTFSVQLDYEADVNIDGLVDGIDLSDLADSVVLTTGVQTITGDRQISLHQKLGVVRTLLDRKNKIITEDKDKEEEEITIKNALCNCGYPSWSFEKVKQQMDTPKQKKKAIKKDETTKSKGLVVIPYVENVSERVARTLKSYNISAAMKPHCTLRNMLVHPKDKRDPLNTTEVVYSIPCKNCNETYVSETGRKFGKRLEEHRAEADKACVNVRTRANRKASQSATNKSAITDHVLEKDHIIDWEEAKILGKEADRYKRWIKEAVKIRQQGTTMNRGNKTFLGPVTMDAGMISNDYLIDGVDIVSLNETSVRISMEQEITGMLNFSQDLFILGDLKVDGSIDGLNVPDDVVHINEDDTVTLYGTLEFNNNATFTTIWCSDEIDGISCQDGAGLDILLTSGNQVVFGHSIFMDDIWLDGVSDVTGLIDGIDVPALAADTVYDTGSQTISGKKVFSTSIIFQDNIVVYFLIQDVNLTELDIRAIKLSDGLLQADNELVFDGPVTFEQAVVTNGNHKFGDLTLFDLVSQGPAEDIQGNKVFTTDVVSEDYFDVTGHVNGISLQDFYRDAINTTDVSPRQLPGNFTFLNDVTISANLNVDGLVDGVNVSNIVKMTGNQEIFGETTFDNDLVVDTLVVDGNLLIQDYINELTMSDIINDTLIDMDCVGPLGMQSGHIADEQITASDYFVGFKPEKARLHNPMNNWVAAVGNPTDPWIQVDFRHEVAITGLQTQGSATAGHYFEWVEMLQIQYGEINDSLTYIMDGATAKTFVANSDRNSVVDIRFHELIITRILRICPTQWEGWTALRFEVIGCDNHHGNQVLTGTKTFQNGLTFGDDITTDGLVDGVDITHMAADGVYKTGDHIITANKTFDIQTNLQEMEVTGTVCNVDTNSLYTRSLQQNMDQTITGNYTFLSNVDMNGNLTVNGNIAGYRFEYEVAHMVLITDSVVDVEINFDNVTSEGNVDVDGLVDYIDVGAEAIHTNIPDQVITGMKTFTRSVTLMTNLDPGTVCRVDIGDLANTTVYQDMNQTITGHKTFVDEMVLQQDLHVDGLVDGVNLTNTDVNVMRTKDISEQRAMVHFSMENVHVLDVVYYNGTLDSVDLIQLNQTYLSLTRDQTINASKTFEGTVQIASSGSLDGDDITLDDAGFINDIDLEDFVAGALMSGVIGQTVNGVKTFGTNLTIEGGVQVDGLLDNIDISGNMMRTDKASTVTGSKRFIGGLMVADENILMGDDILVDGVDLSEWKKYAAFIINDLVINSSVSITEIYLEQDLIVNGLIDDISLNLGGILATIKNQTVTGHKTFLSDVISQRDLDLVGYINGIDVVTLLTDTLLMSRPQIITGTYTLLQKAIFGNLITFGLLNGVCIPELYMQIYTYPKFDVLNASFEQRYELIGNLVKVQENVEVFLDHIAHVQDVVTIGHGQWHGVEYNGSNYLIEAKETEESLDGCVDSRIYKWNETAQNYELETVSLEKEILTPDYPGYFHPSESVVQILVPGIYSSGKTLEPIMATAVDTFIDDGRLFMVVSSLTDDSGYSCFTNKWQLARDAHPQASLPKVYPGSALTSILVKDSVSSDWYVFQHLPCIYPSDVEVFVNPQTGDQCIAITNVIDASYNSRLNVYIYCGNSTVGFTFWKAVPSVGGVKVKHFIVNNVLHLVLANQVDSKKNSFSTKSTVWKLTESGNFARIAQVTTYAAKDVLVIEIKKSTYVIFTSEFKGNYFNQDFDVPVQVYEYIPDGSPCLQWRLDIPSYGARSLGQFVITDQHYLLVLDRMDRVMVYKFKGIQMFEHILTQPITGGEHLEVLNLADVNHIQIAIMSYAQTPILFPGQPAAPSNIASQILGVITEGEVLSALGVESSQKCYPNVSQFINPD
ncbi:uncharacterized protein [Amphiura filiformis]|uniref:uncharacterized protein n=1 Tax=Amphiura filiformis TaxID=82378 RepID=UPI003B2168B0